MSFSRHDCDGGADRQEGDPVHATTLQLLLLTGRRPVNNHRFVTEVTFADLEWQRYFVGDGRVPGRPYRYGPPSPQDRRLGRP